MGVLGGERASRRELGAARVAHLARRRPWSRMVASGRSVRSADAPHMFLRASCAGICEAGAAHHRASRRRVEQLRALAGLIEAPSTTTSDRWPSAKHTGSSSVPAAAARDRRSDLPVRGAQSSGGGAPRGSLLLASLSAFESGPRRSVMARRSPGSGGAPPGGRDQLFCAHLCGPLRWRKRSSGSPAGRQRDFCGLG